MVMGIYQVGIDDHVASFNDLSIRMVKVFPDLNDLRAFDIEVSIIMNCINLIAGYDRFCISDQNFISHPSSLYKNY